MVVKAVFLFDATISHDTGMYLVAPEVVLAPGLVVVAGIRAEGTHDAVQVVCVLEPDVLFHNRQTIHAGRIARRGVNGMSRAGSESQNAP